MHSIRAGGCTHGQLVKPSQLAFVCCFLRYVSIQSYYNYSLNLNCNRATVAMHRAIGVGLTALTPVRIPGIDSKPLLTSQAIHLQGM